MAIVNNWWKVLCVLLLFYTLAMGLLAEVPRLNILNETIRNLYFHVPMWFGMLGVLSISMVHSVLYLSKGKRHSDLWAVETVNTGLLMGFLGLTTGMWWANFTWGDFWSNDPKQNASAIAMLIYLAYLLLRNSVDDQEKRARVSAVYNIFAFAVYVPLIYILPRMTSSLHPGAEGNPAFSSYDLDSQMRMVFYPAVIGWFLLALWISSLRIRLRKVEELSWDKEEI